MRGRWGLIAVCAAAVLLPVRVTAATAEPASPAERQKLAATANDIEQRLLHCDCTYDHPDLDAYLLDVAQRLLATDPTPAPGPIRVRALRGPDANAYALSNGAIFITTALLQQLDSEAQVATILGHELTHFTRSHALEMERHNQRAEAWWYVKSVSSYSRSMEREADSDGLRRMAAAGYDTSEAVVTLERLAAATSEHGKESAPYFSSHPRLSERIASYRALTGGEHSSGIDSGRRIGRNEYLTHTQGLALDQAEILIAARQPERAATIIAAELDRSETARGRYLEGEAARLRWRTADGETLALIAYERAAELPDPPPGALRQAALIHRLRGETTAASDEFQRYLEMAPAADDAPLVRAYLAVQAASPLPPSPPGDHR